MFWMRIDVFVDGLLNVFILLPVEGRWRGSTERRSGPLGGDRGSG
jgi:hypothetical protein